MLCPIPFSLASSRPVICPVPVLHLSCHLSRHITHHPVPSSRKVICPVPGLPSVPSSRAIICAVVTDRHLCRHRLAPPSATPDPDVSGWRQHHSTSSRQEERGGPERGEGPCGANDVTPDPARCWVICTANKLLNERFDSSPEMKRSDRGS